MTKYHSTKNQKVDADKGESIDFLRKKYRNEATLFFRAFLFALLLSLPFVIHELFLWLEVPFYFPPLIQLILATLTLFGPGYLVYQSAYRELKLKKWGLNCLSIVGASIAFGFSLGAYLGSTHVFLYFGISSLLIFTSLWAQWLEVLLKRKKLVVLEEYQRILPATTNIEKKSQIEKILTSSLQIDDLFIVDKGDYIPADGIVVEGHAIVNESIFGGESLAKQARAILFAGTWVEEGSLKVRTTQVGENATVAKILGLFKQSSKHVNEPFAFLNKIIVIYLFLWVLTAIGTGIGWVFWGGVYTDGFINAIAVLIIGCPLALGFIASPVLLIATEVGERHGISFKDPAIVLKIDKIKIMIFEKLGALTEGCPIVQNVLSTSSHRISDILSIAASLANQSPHSLARAIVKKAYANGISFEPPQDFERIAGRAIVGKINGKLYTLSTVAFAKELKNDIETHMGRTLALEADLMSVEKKGKTILVLWNDKKVLGCIVIADNLRKMTEKTILELKERDIHSMMLTADPKDIALEIAWKIKVEDVKFNLLPAEQAKEVLLAKRVSTKPDHILRTPSEQESGKVGMVGNATYDVLSLTQSDVSFSIGTSRTLELTDVTLRRADLLCLVDAIDLSRASVRKIKQNMALAFLFPLFAVSIAAAGQLTPEIAMGTIAVSIISIFANTLILRYWKPS